MFKLTQIFRNIHIHTIIYEKERERKKREKGREERTERVHVRKKMSYSAVINVLVYEEKYTYALD